MGFIPKSKTAASTALSTEFAFENANTIGAFSLDYFTLEWMQVNEGRTSNLFEDFVTDVYNDYNFWVTYIIVNVFHACYVIVKSWDTGIIILCFFFSRPWNSNEQIRNISISCPFKKWRMTIQGNKAGIMIESIWQLSCFITVLPPTNISLIKKEKEAKCFYYVEY